MKTYFQNNDYLVEIYFAKKIFIFVDKLIIKIAVFRLHKTLTWSCRSQCNHCVFDVDYGAKAALVHIFIEDEDEASIRAFGKV